MRRKSQAADCSAGIISRRVMLKIVVAGGAAIIARANGTIRATATEVPAATLPPGKLAKVTAQEVSATARHLYDYDLSSGDAEAIAATTDSTLRNLRYLKLLKLSDTEPPFDYECLSAEAERLKIESAQ